MMGRGRALGRGMDGYKQNNPLTNSSPVKPPPGFKQTFNMGRGRGLALGIYVVMVILK